MNAGAAIDSRPKVIKFVQELLTDDPDAGPVTAARIGEQIDLVLRMKPQWSEGLDREAVTGELIRRFSVWIGQDATLVNREGHRDWLDAARKTDWRYWQRYREWTEAKLSIPAVDALDRATDGVLGLLEDPERAGPWDRRGLVVGHVQSGKTGNYTGLICKAADAGYKIIIVLAGLHNNLRSQTQMRLDEGFLGYETRPSDDELRLIGVGQIDQDPSIRPNYATNRTDNGDFNTRFARNLGISPEQRPWLFVVKKNKTVLERLHKWIRDHVANVTDPETGRRIVTNLPLLVIDDEADNASVDTGEQVFDADGKPDPDHTPTAINRLIRRTLHTFNRSAYVGYTATPFANIFIHERGETADEGPDLFPAAFIVSLAAPSSYCGPARMFGLQSPEGRLGLPLLRPVADYEGEDDQTDWMPQKHKSWHQPRYNGEDALPPSLLEAIDAFVLSCAARRLRGQERDHASMLVHVTRFNAVQQSVYRQVDDRIRELRQRLTRNVGAEEALGRLHALWERDFVPTTERVRATDPDESGPPLPAWPTVREVLADAVADIEVRMINGTAKDALDYVEHGATGLKVIAIGGDKLARGLTLEGLSVSYFLRASKMYDTLMQMGRWFGYRPGYVDLCRLYTTAELTEWFGHIADAAEELREEFDLMAAVGGTPRDYGLKVQAHPAMMVTSRLKMRTARNLMLNFSGQILETTVLRTGDAAAVNLGAVRTLLEGLGSGEENPRRSRQGSIQEWKGALWENVSAARVRDFMTSYRTHPNARKVNGALIADFIAQMNAAGELKHWTVAVIGGGQGLPLRITGTLEVNALVRQNEQPESDGYAIGRLLSPRDEGIDLGEAEWVQALALTRETWRSDPARMQRSGEPDLPSGPAIRHVRGEGAGGAPGHRDRGLLLLYALTPRARDNGGTEDQTVIGFGVSFPGSDAGVKVEYKVNNVLWEAEYGASE